MPKRELVHASLAKMAQKSPFLGHFFGIFFEFSGPNPARGILYSFRIFFVFSGFRGFCNLYQARRAAKTGMFTWFGTPCEAIVDDFVQSAPKERRRRRAEKRLSKTLKGVFGESVSFFFAP